MSRREGSPEKAHRQAGERGGQQGGQRLGQQQSWGPGPENLALAQALHGPDVVRHIHFLLVVIEQLLGEGQDLWEGQGSSGREVREGVRRVGPAQCVAQRKRMRDAGPWRLGVGSGGGGAGKELGFLSRRDSCSRFGECMVPLPTVVLSEKSAPQARAGISLTWGLVGPALRPRPWDGWFPGAVQGRLHPRVGPVYLVPVELYWLLEHGPDHLLVAGRCGERAQVAEVVPQTLLLGEQVEEADAPFHCGVHICGDRGHPLTHLTQSSGPNHADLPLKYIYVCIYLFGCAGS